MPTKSYGFLLSELEMYAERDVIESVRENVHDNRPVARRLAREMATSQWTFPRSVKGPR